MALEHLLINLKTVYVAQLVSYSGAPININQPLTAAAQVPQCNVEMVLNVHLPTDEQTTRSPNTKRRSTVHTLPQDKPPFHPRPLNKRNQQHRHHNRVP